MENIATPIENHGVDAFSFGAFGDEGDVGVLTELGEAMAALPIGPRHARMLLAAAHSGVEGCLEAAVAAAAALSLDSPFLRDDKDGSGELDWSEFMMLSQARCSRDAAEIQPRYIRDTAEIQPTASLTQTRRPPSDSPPAARRSRRRTARAQLGRAANAIFRGGQRH